MISASYDAFGCLFGVRNYANFDPVAASRGIPVDASSDVVKESTGLESDEIETLENDLMQWDVERVIEAAARAGNHSATWISAQEIAALNYEVLASKPDQRVSRYKIMPDGSLKLDGKELLASGSASSFGEACEKAAVEQFAEARIEKMWRTDEFVFVQQYARVGDVLTEEFRLVFEVMQTLCNKYGTENVRLVVWFDD